MESIRREPSGAIVGWIIVLLILLLILMASLMPLRFAPILEYLPWISAFAIALILVLASVKVMREYERAVLFRVGRLVGVKGPGLILKIPIADRLAKVDLRIKSIDVPVQRIITRDNVTVDVDAVVYYRVFDPTKAIVNVEDYMLATNLLSQTTLRDVLGQSDLDELLSKREELSKRLTSILDVLTDPWGIKVTNVTIKSVSLPEAMLRALAKQAEAERERRARIIVAQAEEQASRILAEAARVYGDPSLAIRLRELQTLTEIAREKNMIVIAPSALSDIGAALGIARQVAEAPAKPKGEGEAKR
jgi:regulator of protease activity HflC (stomatin/prohibitin superfamily)